MALRLAYALDESSGAFAEASGGTSGTLTATGSYVAGHTGNGIQSSTGDPAGTVEGSPLLTSGSWTAITVMAWFKNAGNSGDMLAAITGAPTDVFGFKFASSTEIAVWCRTNTTHYEFSGYTHGVGVGSWLHIAMTWSAADTTQRMFLNGSQVDSASHAGATLVGNMTRLSLAGGDTGWGSGPGATPIDDFRLFDSAESGANITTYMNTPVGGGAPAAPLLPMIIRRPAVIRAAYW
jgi:hypothetical protein